MGIMGLTKTERFKRWRGVKAGEEQMFIDTANHVDAYLLSASYLRIKQDLSHGEGEKSEQYELIQKAPKPGTSILLHCKLDIEEAADLLSGPAKKTLKRLEYHLGSLYSNYANKPAERVEALLNSFAALLELEISVFSDRKRARNLYHTIYFALGSTDKKLTNLPPGVGFLARFYGIDIEKSHSSVKALMRRIEDRMMVFGTDMKLEELDDDLDSDDSTEESHDATGVTVDTQLNSQQGSGTLLEKGAQIKAVTGAQVDTVTGQVGAVTTTLLSVDANKPQTEKAQAVAVEAEQDPLTPEQQAIQNTLTKDI